MSEGPGSGLGRELGGGADTLRFAHREGPRAQCLPMFHVVLFEPEIPPNTGNVIRLCANTGAHLHLVEPLGFSLSDKALARAGLDYHDLARVSVHRGWEDCRRALGERRLFAVTTRGSIRYDTPRFEAGDAFSQAVLAFLSK